MNDKKLSRDRIQQNCYFLFFTERSHQLVAKRLGEIGKHGAVTRLHEGLNRHAWNETNVAEPCDFIRRHRDADGVEALAGALVHRGVGRDAADCAVEFRCCALVESGQP